jgi:nucleoside-diphosphate-sugar epimerase
MKILITGIHGFVGSNIVESLRAKHELYGLDIVVFANKNIERTFNWDELDLIPEVDVVIHLAGKAHDLKNKSYANEYFEVNTGLTIRIFDWFFCSRAHKFIFFSSVKAVADVVEGDVLTEDCVPKPIGPYGESKRSAEVYILNQQSESKQKRVYILRPSMIHGLGNKGNLNMLFSFVKKGIPWPLGAFDNRRSFTSIDNVNFIIHKLIDIDVDSGVYNISDDEPVSTNILISTIANAINKPVRIWCVNKSIINCFAKVGTCLHLPLNKDRLRKLTENYIVSNQKIKEALNIEKLPVNSIEGLSNTIKSFIK